MLAYQERYSKNLSSDDTLRFLRDSSDRDYTVCISNNFLTPDDHILFIDDFLAYGNAAMGMLELARQAGSTVAGMGFIIEKAFQGGAKELQDKGVRVESLAVIESLDDCKITIRP